MTVWNQQFSSASFEQMLEEVGSDSRGALEQVRGWIAEQLGWKSQMKHFHSSWGWAEAYEGQKGKGASLLSVYVIPEPGRERAALSFSKSMLDSIHNVELPKGIQLEIREGTCVRDTVWVECSLRTSGEADGVCSLLEVLGGKGS